MSSTRANPFTPIKQPAPLLRKKTDAHVKAPFYNAHELMALYDLPKSVEYDDFELTAEEEKYKGQNLKVHRHLLTTSGEIRFGREGKPNNRIPSHSVMGQGLAAGNTYVNPQNEIVKFNNQSGQNEPQARTLQYMVMAYRLMALTHPGIKIAAEIEIEFLFFNKSMTDKRLILSRAEFFQLGDELIEQYRNNPHFLKANGTFLFEQKGNELSLTKKRHTNSFFESKRQFYSPIKCSLPSLKPDGGDSNVASGAPANALLSLRNNVVLPVRPEPSLFHSTPYPKLPSVSSFLNWRVKSPNPGGHDNALLLPRPEFDSDSQATETPTKKLRLDK